MKKTLSFLLALALLALSCAGLAEAHAGTGMPAAGDVVQGFEVLEIRDYSLMDATIVRFRHQKTGGELFYIANDDTNRAFQLSFRTEAIDNTGLPHVFEHATIQGSKNFPGEQMFFNALYRTYNTFMNASTSQWFTCYPLASLSEKQLLKLAEFYTDACFYPAIMENEHIYRTEAWRYRMETPEDPLTLEGTVYSEMLGAMTLKRTAYRNLFRAAYPGSLAGNEPGGLPDDIPNMTWQMLKDYHDTYYHPSNSVAYLYGQFEDYTAFLKLLDSYYSGFERKEFNHDDAGYTPLTESVVQSLPFPVEQSSDTEHASTIFYAFLCPGLKADLEQYNLMNTLTDLLNHSGSDLSQHIQKALPHADFSVFIESTGPDSAIAFALSNADPEDAETLKTIVDEALQDVAENGFPQDLVESAAASLEISVKLTRESSDPVDNICIPMLESYVSTHNPWGLQDYQDSLGKIAAWNQQGRYAESVSRWLLSDPVTVLSTTYPEAGAREKKDAQTAEKLAALKASMSDEEIAAIVEATNAEPAEDPSDESVARLKAVTVASLPEELPHYDVSDETDADGIRHIDAIAQVDGISMTSLMLDAAGLPQEDIHWFQLYTSIVGKLDTTAHTKAELATLFGRYLYNGSIHLSLPKDGQGGYHPYLRMNWIALDDDLAPGYDLMRELVFDTKVDDVEKLMEQVSALRSSFKSELIASPTSPLVLRGLARFMPMYAHMNYATGLDYYAFLGEVEQQLRDDPEAVTERLKGIQAHFNNRANAVTLCAGNAASIALNRQLSDAFLGSLDKRDITPVQYDFPIPAQREALVLDIGVQYNVLVGDLAAAGLQTFDGGMDAVTTLVTDTFLVPLLRDQYGVYTPNVYADEDSMYVYAYRDPNIAETYAVLETLPGLISNMELDQDALDGYIMSAYSGYAMPEGALSGPANAALETLQGLSHDRIRDWMREIKQVTPDTVRARADVFASLFKNGARLTAGSASAINANAEQFDVILNPFGAVDKTQQALSDVAKGDAAYEAVRFAFESGLMEAHEDGSFGAADPATQGDLAAALMAVLQQPADAGDAVQALIEAGILDASATPDAALTAGDCAAVLTAFTQALGLEYPGDLAAQAEPFTRAALAEALKAYVNWLNAQQAAA